MAEIWFCPNCGPRELDIRGRCSGCGSDQVVLDHRAEVIPEAVKRPRKPTKREVSKALERISSNEQLRIDY